ncbi:hypothetical protein D0812_11595 [Vibrio owensii]|uniref:Uncharacterized protein n=1 Tax=Vibrio owensii TaxID=696485 RepID=A0AAP9KAA7_9VIBR|nr:hypothetical protein [Vibrio owensii]AYO15023.1 hypothetical protein D0812_11595 [Vibrio owensii]QGH47306.1 hypothetical protein APZ19_09490 [Vibrio owensii]
MANIKRVSLRLLVVAAVAFLLPWFFSLGTYFSGYVHFQDEDHEILLTAKSGVYKTIHSFEGQVYRVHTGIYASLGSSMYFFSLEGNYIEGLDPQFADKVIALDLSRYFRGLTHVKLAELSNGKWIGKMQKDDSELLFDEVVFNGRLVGW